MPLLSACSPCPCQARSAGGRGKGSELKVLERRWWGVGLGAGEARWRRGERRSRGRECLAGGEGGRCRL